MSAATAASSTTHRREVPQAKKSFWSLRGKKASIDDKVVHEPFTATLPHVNLLPASVHDSIKAGKIRSAFILGGLLIAAAVGGVWYLQSSQITAAEGVLQSAQLENAALQTRLEGIAPVQDMYRQINSLKGLVDTSLASQPEAALVIRQVRAAAEQATGGSSPVSFSNISVTYQGIPTPPATLNQCPNPDPFSIAVTVGCLNFTATAQNREQVSSLLRLLAADPLFVGPYVTSTTITDAAVGKAVSFSGSAGISLEALKTKLTPEQIAALTSPPTTTEGTP
jgi:Tfp pilus assembly protein PilN